MEELYRENAKIVYFYIFRQCKNHDLAEKITQEMFLRAMNCVETYDFSCKVSVWLCSIAKHIYWQHLRKYKREVPTEYVEPQQNASDNVEAQVLERCELIDVLEQIKKLPLPMREVVMLRDDICSDDTRKLVEEHMSVCEECRRTLDTMKDTQVNMAGNETLQIDHLKKIRSRYNMISLGSYLLLFMLLLPVVYFICRDIYPLSDTLFPMVLPILIIAAFLTAGSARAFTKKKACLCAISCILLFCEFLLMRTAFVWVTEETLPFGMKTEHIGPFIRNLLLVMMVCELVILIYSIVYGRFKNTDNTYCAAISVTGVILSLSYINLLKRLENVDRFLSSVNQIMIFLTAELIILLVSYVIIGRFRKM